MPGSQGPKTVRAGGPKWPELCIKTVIRLCTGISQNRHPCLLRTLPFRAGRYLLLRNLFLILWFRSYSDVISDVIARSECLPGGGKNYSYATAVHALLPVRVVRDRSEATPWAPCSALLHYLVKHSHRPGHGRSRVIAGRTVHALLFMLLQAWWIKMIIIVYYAYTSVQSLIYLW